MTREELDKLKSGLALIEGIYGDALKVGAIVAAAVDLLPRASHDPYGTSRVRFDDMREVGSSVGAEIQRTKKIIAGYDPRELTCAAPGVQCQEVRPLGYALCRVHKCAREGCHEASTHHGNCAAHQYVERERPSERT